MSLSLSPRPAESVTAAASAWGHLHRLPSPLLALTWPARHRSAGWCPPCGLVCVRRQRREGAGGVCAGACGRGDAHGEFVSVRPALLSLSLAPHFSIPSKLTPRNTPKRSRHPHPHPSHHVGHPGRRPGRHAQADRGHHAGRVPVRGGEGGAAPGPAERQVGAGRCVVHTPSGSEEWPRTCEGWPGLSPGRVGKDRAPGTRSERAPGAGKANARPALVAFVPPTRRGPSLVSPSRTGPCWLPPSPNHPTIGASWRLSPACAGSMVRSTRAVSLTTLSFRPPHSRPICAGRQARVGRARRRRPACRDRRRGRGAPDHHA